MSKNFFFPENRAFYEILWPNIEERGRSHMTTRRMRIACYITKITHAQYAIRIVFPLQH